MPVLFIPWLIFSVLYKFEMPAGYWTAPECADSTKKPLCRKYFVLSRVALRQWRHSCFCLDTFMVVEMNIAIYHLICFLERVGLVPVDTFRFQD